MTLQTELAIYRAQIRQEIYRELGFVLRESRIYCIFTLSAFLNGIDPTVTARDLIFDHQSQAA